MPRLEPQAADSSSSSSAGLLQTVEANGGADPGALIDKILSSLPPDKLASFSKLFEAKLEAAGLRGRSSDAATTMARPPGLSTSGAAENEAAAVKKLADYRKKMKRKREDEAAARLLDDLCERLRAFKGTGDDGRVARPAANYLKIIDWDTVHSRWSRVKPAPTEPLASPSANSAQNLEAEASEDDDDDSGEGAECASSPAPATHSSTSSSLKVRIRLLRAKTEKPVLKCEETPPDLARSQSPPPLLNAFGFNLPPKKRFKRNPPPNAASSSPDPGPSSPATEAAASAVCKPPKLPLMTIRRRKRLPYPWDRKKKKKREAKSGEIDCLAPESAPPLLKIEPIAVVIVSPLPSPAAPFSEPRLEAKKLRLSPGLLRKCGRCGVWRNSKAGGLDQKTDGSETVLCKNCRRRRSPLPPAFSIRMTPPKKKFSKFGAYFDPFSTEIDQNEEPNRLSLWSPQRCAALTETVDFQLPFDLWWRFVHQKEYICSNPSANYKRISRNIYADSKVARAPNCQPCGCAPPDDDGGETCGESCLNRLMFTECTPSLCPCGERCSNRRFQRRLWAPGLEKFSTGLAKGLGIRATLPLRAGDFICEYVGEVVNAETFAERTRSWYRRCRHHYALTVDSGAVIDAYRCGGLARFINHSCEPNCEVQKWVVNGRYRMGVFALKDVPAGRELTYNYNFRSFSRPQRCLCGSEKCSGAVGGSFKPARRGVGRPPAALSTSTDDNATAAIFGSGTRTGRLYLTRLLVKAKKFGRSAAAASCESTDGDETPSKFLVMRKNRRPKSSDDPQISRLRLVRSALRLVIEKLNELRDSSGKSVGTAVDTSLPESRRTLVLARSVLPTENPELPICRLLVRILGADESATSTNEPLVGAYDPDDDRGTEIWTDKADAVHPTDDKVRCFCGIFDEDGTMVQCDHCLYWLHADCIGGTAAVGDPTAGFKCDFCARKGYDDTRSVFRDVVLTPQPRVRLPHCTYYRSLVVNGRLQIRIGDCVYVKKNVDERHKRILAAFNRRCVSNDLDQEESPAPVSEFEVGLVDDTDPGPFHRSQLRIMRVERLFVGPEGVRLIFGSYFAHPHETFCEPNRRFFRNEVFVTPLYDTRPLESAVGRCLVLDPSTFRKGRPLYPQYAEADVYVCEYRVDKGQRLFDKSSVKSRYPLNTKPHIFRRFQERLKISRDYMPFFECPSDEIKKSDKQADDGTSTAVSAEWNHVAMQDSDAEELKTLMKRLRLERLTSRLRSKADPVQL